MSRTVNAVIWATIIAGSIVSGMALAISPIFMVLSVLGFGIVAAIEMAIPALLEKPQPEPATAKPALTRMPFLGT